MEPRISTRGNPTPNPRRSGRKRKVGLDASQMYEESKKEKVLAKVFELMKSACLEVIGKLTSYDFAAPFLQPVDSTLPGCEQYYELIKDPMDFTTLKSKMEQRLYGSLDEWIDDVRMIFINCYTYNQIGSEICNYAGALSMMFERQLDGLRDKEDEFLEEAELAEMKSTMQQLYEEQAKMMQELTKLKLESENPQPIVYQQPAPIPKKTNTKQAPKPQKKKKATSSANPKKPAQSSFSRKRKAQLTQNITILSQQSQNLEGILQIVQAELPKDKQEGEVELDLDAMSTQTLFKLENYVNQCLNKSSSYSGPSVRRKKLHPEDYDETASNLSRGEESSSSDESEGELDVVY